MSRVLITGGAGMLGAAVARRLLADPAYDVRIADEREAPQWMREACEIRGADMRAAEGAQAARPWSEDDIRPLQRIVAIAHRAARGDQDRNR